MMIYEPTKHVSRSASHHVVAPARPLMTQREQGLQTILAERESQIMELEYALSQCRAANKAWEEDYDLLKAHEHELRTELDAMMVTYVENLDRANEKIYRLTQQCQRCKVDLLSFQHPSDDSRTRPASEPNNDIRPIYRKSSRMDSDCLWVEQTVARQSLLRSVEDVIREIDLEIHELDQRRNSKEGRPSISSIQDMPMLCSQSMTPPCPSSPDLPVSSPLSAFMSHAATITPPPKYSSPPPQPRQHPLTVHSTQSTGPVIQREKQQHRKRHDEPVVSRSKSQHALDTLFHRKKQMSERSPAALVKSGTVHKTQSDEAAADKRAHPSQQRRRRPLSECQADKNSVTTTATTTKKSKPVLRRMSIQAFMLSNKMAKT